MKFVCDKCQQRYHVDDRKVGRRTLRIRCRQCGSVISVRDPHTVNSEADIHPARAVAGKRAVQGPASGAHRTVSGSLQKIDEIAWHYSVNGKSFGPFQEDDLIAKFLSGQIGDEAYVWNVDMEGWRPAVEIPVFSPAIEEGKRRHPKLPTLNIPSMELETLRESFEAQQQAAKEAEAANLNVEANLAGEEPSTRSAEEPTRRAVLGKLALKVAAKEVVREPEPEPEPAPDFGWSEFASESGNFEAPAAAEKPEAVPNPDEAAKTAEPEAAEEPSGALSRLRALNERLATSPEKDTGTPAAGLKRSAPTHRSSGRIPRPTLGASKPLGAQAPDLSIGTKGPERQNLGQGTPDTLLGDALSLERATSAAFDSIGLFDDGSPSAKGLHTGDVEAVQAESIADALNAAEGLSRFGEEAAEPPVKGDAQPEAIDSPATDVAATATSDKPEYDFHPYSVEVEAVAQEPVESAEEPESADELAEANELAEAAEKQPALVAEEPEVAAEEPEVAAEEPEVDEDSQLVTEQPKEPVAVEDVAAVEAPEALEEAEAEAFEPELVADQLELTEEPEVAEEEAPVAAEQPEPIEEPDAVEEPEAIEELVEAQPEVVEEEAELVADEPELTAEQVEQSEQLEPVEELEAAAEPEAPTEPAEPTLIPNEHSAELAAVLQEAEAVVDEADSPTVMLTPLDDEGGAPTVMLAPLTDSQAGTDDADSPTVMLTPLSDEQLQPEAATAGPESIDGEFSDDEAEELDLEDLTSFIEEVEESVEVPAIAQAQSEPAAIALEPVETDPVAAADDEHDIDFEEWAHGDEHDGEAEKAGPGVSTLPGAPELVKSKRSRRAERKQAALLAAANAQAEALPVTTASALIDIKKVQRSGRSKRWLIVGAVALMIAGIAIVVPIVQSNSKKEQLDEIAAETDTDSDSADAGEGTGRAAIPSTDTAVFEQSAAIRDGKRLVYQALRGARSNAQLAGEALLEAQVAQLEADRQAEREAQHNSDTRRTRETEDPPTQNGSGSRFSNLDRRATVAVNHTVDEEANVRANSSDVGAEYFAEDLPRVRRAVQRCHEIQLREANGSTIERVVVDITVEPTGDVVLGIDSSIANTAFARCLQTRYQTWSFRRFEGTSVTLQRTYALQ